MTSLPGVPARLSSKRPFAGVVVGVGAFAVVAVPLAFTAIAAMASFSGCFIACSEPDPLVGTLYAATALFLLAVPVIAGLVTARVLTAPGWGIALGLTTVLLGFLVGPRLGYWLFS